MSYINSWKCGLHKDLVLRRLTRGSPCGAGRLIGQRPSVLIIVIAQWQWLCVTVVCNTMGWCGHHSSSRQLGCSGFRPNPNVIQTYRRICKRGNVNDGSVYHTYIYIYVQGCGDDHFPNTCDIGTPNWVWLWGFTMSLRVQSLQLYIVPILYENGRKIEFSISWDRKNEYQNTHHFIENLCLFCFTFIAFLLRARSWIVVLLCSRNWQPALPNMPN